METIRILKPPKEAFNKNRRVSDLIRQQVNHLKHVEAKLPAEKRVGIPQHVVVTEDDAARYIAAMTRLLRGEPAAINTPVPISIPARPAAAGAGQGLALAASGERAARSAGAPASKKAKKSVPAKGKK
jgi:hypothetical protein